MSLRSAAGLVILFALGAFATATAQSPARFAVTGVKASDVLNIREQPNAKAPIAGKIPHNSVSVFETPETPAPRGWVAVSSSYGAGYVNARYLKPWPGPRKKPALQFPLSCAGTEPFWSAELNGKTIVFDDANDLTDETFKQTGAPQQTEPNVWIIKGKRKAGAWAATLRETEACSDGMSEYVFRYEYDDGAVKGCCTRLP